MSTCAFFLYTRSNDVAASRRFYSDLLGLDQIWDEEGDIAYVFGDSVQFSIGDDPAATADEEWAFQPGWVFGLEIAPKPGVAAGPGASRYRPRSSEAPSPGCRKRKRLPCALSPSGWAIGATWSKTLWAKPSNSLTRSAMAPETIDPLGSRNPSLPGAHCPSDLDLTVDSIRVFSPTVEGSDGSRRPHHYLPGR